MSLLTPPASIALSLANLIRNAYSFNNWLALLWYSVTTESNRLSLSPYMSFHVLVTECRQTLPFLLSCIAEIFVWMLNLRHHVFHLQQACIHILVVRETASNVIPTFSLSKAIYFLIHAHNSFLHNLRIWSTGQQCKNLPSASTSKLD